MREKAREIGREATGNRGKNESRVIEGEGKKWGKVQVRREGVAGILCYLSFFKVIGQEFHGIHSHDGNILKMMR